MSLPRFISTQSQLHMLLSAVLVVIAAKPTIAAGSTDQIDRPDQPALAIYQHSRVAGPVAMVVTKDALRCRLSASKLTFIVPPGRDQLYVFSVERRKILTMPLKQPQYQFFRGLISSTGCDFSDLEMVPSRAKEVAGHHTLAFKTSARCEQKLVDRINNAVMGSRSAVGLHTYYFDDLKPAIDNRSGEFLASLLGLPHSHGYPGRVTVVKPDGSVFNYLETSALKTIRVSAGEFAPPRGYSTAKSIVEVMGEAGNEDALHWMK